jgi:hypothetical protein
MKKCKQTSRGNGCCRPTAKNGSATGQGASPEDIEHQGDEKRKLPPVPIAVALKRVRPATQTADVMACLSSTAEFVAMPILSRRSGSLNVHSVVAQIRRRFRWVISNEMVRFGSAWHSRYRLIAPAPSVDTP